MISFNFTERTDLEQKGKTLKVSKLFNLQQNQMAILKVILVALGVMVIMLIITCHSLPAQLRESTKEYQDDEDTDYDKYYLQTDFTKLLKRYVTENKARDGSLHGHIVAVNQAHLEAEKRVENKKRVMLASDNSQGVPIMEEIESTNEGEMKELPFEGDIKLLPEDRVMIDEQGTGTQSRRNVINLTKMRSRLWPNGIVRYAIASNVVSLRPKIIAAINMFEKHTCLRFIEVSLPYRGDFIKYHKGKGCGSFVGRIGKRQKVSLGSGCEYIGVIMHETMHALGVWHEQSRPDRDKWVQVLWNNIDPKFVHNFKKFTTDSVDTLGLPYDYRSIMHYDRFLFAKRPGLLTLIARNMPWRRLGGQRDAIFTSNDIKEIKKMYNCS